MKKLLNIFIFTLFSISIYGQNQLDLALNEISKDIANKLQQKNKKRIVVLYITDVNKKQTTAGKYLADVLSVNFVNNPNNFDVFDRENLSEITEVKKLIAEGFVDVNNVKELGKILAVEGVIIGSYTALSNSIKLSLRALDVNTGYMIAASMKDLPLTADLGALLGINIQSGGGEISNRGFNTPLKSGENYNSPGTVSNDCEKLNAGDYCFTNMRNFTIQLHYTDRLNSAFDNNQLTIEPGQTCCLYNLKAGVWYYSFYDPTKPTERFTGKYQKVSGQFLVEKCKSKTQIIR